MASKLLSTLSAAHLAKKMVELADEVTAFGDRATAACLVALAYTFLDPAATDRGSFFGSEPVHPPIHYDTDAPVRH